MLHLLIATYAYNSFTFRFCKCSVFVPLTSSKSRRVTAVVFFMHSMKNCKIFSSVRKRKPVECMGGKIAGKTTKLIRSHCNFSFDRPSFFAVHLIFKDFHSTHVSPVLFQRLLMKFHAYYTVCSKW